jgi:hypothetical protein
MITGIGTAVEIGTDEEGAAPDGAAGAGPVGRPPSAESGTGTASGSFPVWASAAVALALIARSAATLAQRDEKPCILISS